MASSRYGSRTAVYVVMGADATVIAYGFNTNMDAGDQAALGHQALDYSAPPARLVLGANRPKPGRATKQSATESNSSFYAAAQATTLRAAGWKLTFPKTRAGKGANGRLTKEYYVTINGIKYAWALPNKVATQLGGDGVITSLGLKPTEATESDYVFGARFPKPPRAVLVKEEGGSLVTASTFMDPSATVPTGFSQVAGYLDLTP